MITGSIRTRRIGACALLWSLIATQALAACGGGDDFENRPRPPVPLQLTGVITEERVTVSPNKVGAGPIVLTISNQTDAAHSVTLSGTAVEERVGPINPLDTAAIQKTLQPGEYVVRAGSEKAVGKGREIKPGTLVIGPERSSSSDELLLP